MQKSFVKHRVFPAVAVLLASAITLGALELVAWLALHKHWPRKPGIPTNEWVILTGHGRRLRPNLDFTQWFQMSGQNVRLRTNSIGFRGDEVPVQKTPGKKRVLVLGDSITLAAYLPEDQTFTTLAAKILSASAPTEVINAGVYDVGLREEILILKESGLKLKPDLVVLGFYLNDSRPPWGFENEYYNLPPRLTEASKTLEQYSYLYMWIWRRILVTHFLGHNMAKRLNWQDEYNSSNWREDQAAYQHLIQSASLDWGSAWDEKSWTMLYSGLDELRGLAEKNHFQLVVLIFPVAVQVRSNVYDDFPQQKMKSYCASHQLPCLDLLPLLREHQAENIYYDHCHFTAEGHRLIAGPIAQFIADNEPKAP